MNREEAIAYGAKQAVEACVRVRANDCVVIITDRETKHLGDAIEKAAKNVTANVKLFVMEDFGTRDLSGAHPLAFPEAIANAMKEATASFYIAQGKKGELKTFRRPMCDYVDQYKIRHAHMIGFTEKMMGTGMAVDYQEVQRVTKLVFDFVQNKKKIHVTTPAGTDFTAEFSPNLKWIISDGNIQPMNWKNLPDGETFTAPLNANGHVVVDGTLGDFFSEKYGLLEKNPVSYDLKDGWVVKGSIKSANKELEAEFTKYVFETDANSARLGEFAIGTNVGLKGLIGNLLQDEKFPGVHIAIGNPYPEKTGADWKSDAHCDGVLQKTTIVVDGTTIMANGKFDFNILEGKTS